MESKIGGEGTSVSLPSWIGERGSAGSLPKGRRVWRKDFMSKMLSAIRTRMQRERLLTQGRETIFHQMNTPAKTLCIVLLLISVGLTHSLYYLVGLQILCILGALYLGMKLSSFVCRTYLPVLVFSGLAILPGIFSFISPGQVALYLYQGGPPWWAPFLPNEIYISWPGLQSLGYVFFRSLNSISLSVLFLRVTPWNAFTRSLTKCGIPSIIVMMLDITYRYLYLFMPLLEEYILGRKSRMVGTERYGDTLSWVGSAIADLARVTDAYATQVFEGLQSRGYVGEYVMPMPWHFGPREAICLILSIACLILGGTQWEHLFLR